MVGGASSMADQNYVQDVKGKGYRSERNLHGNLIPEILPLVEKKNDKRKKKDIETILDGADTASRLGSYASPVLVAVLDATKCSETNGQDEEEGPCGSDNETNREEGQCGSGDDERFGGGYSSGCRCGGLGVCVGGSGACPGEDAIDERCLLGRQGGFNFLASNGVLCGEVDLRDKEGLEGFSEAMLAAVLYEKGMPTYWVMAEPIRLSLILPTYMRTLSSCMPLMLCLFTVFSYSCPSTIGALRSRLVKLPCMFWTVAPR